MTTPAHTDTTSGALTDATSGTLTSATSGVLTNATSGALTNSTMPAAESSTAGVVHAPSHAAHVASVRTHVPITLDLQKSNFTKWRMLVRVLLGKYDLLHHVNAIAPAIRTAEWIRDDYIVRSWLYGSISDEILDIIMGEEQTAQEAWLLITNLFLDNQMTRAVHLDAEFRAMVQGDLSITAYCHRLKALSDALRDVGSPVTDQVLVLNCLRGLNPRFADITTIVTMQNPLPSFAQTRSLLTLRETQLANSHRGGAQTALYGASNPSYGFNNNGGNSSGSGSFGGKTGGGGNYYKKKKNGGGGGNYGGNRTDGAGRGTPAPVGPWVCFNPYTGQAQQMQAPPPHAPQAPAPRPSAGAGLLGPRPFAMPPAQAFTSLAPLHGQAFGTNPPPIPGYINGNNNGTSPAWDCSALMAALNNAATPSHAGEWVMDSGATAHMASDPGPSHQGRDPSLQ
ncbi:uncharacterized protein [Lolium perenne]|uniref:uncharacterized protein n=1 Tax=Lolium perenne TaxID=4522 RepID=UPI003A9A5B17